MEVLIFGSHNGEAIIIKCDEWICVIDSYAHDDSTPVADYLKKEKISSIDLLVVTHPHADHYDGIHFLENFTVKKFLAYNQIGSNFQKVLFNLWDEESKKQNAIIDWLNNERSKYKKFFEAIDAFKTKCQAEFYSAARTPSTFMTTTVNGKQLDLKILTPFDHIIGPSIDEIKSKAKAGKLSLLSLTNQHEQNMFSTSIEISFNNRKALFLADVDNENLIEMTKSGFTPDYDLIKVSHHGSPNGNAKEFWSAIRTQKKPCTAVITNHDKHELPHPGIIKLIRNAVKATNGLLRVIPKNKKPTGLKFDLSTGGPHQGTAC